MSPQDLLPAKIQDCGKPRPIDDKVWLSGLISKWAENTSMEQPQSKAVKGDGLRQNWVGRLMARLRPDFPTGFF
jgi:hypothetical protein